MKRESDERSVKIEVTCHLGVKLSFKISSSSLIKLGQFLTPMRLLNKLQLSEVGNRGSIHPRKRCAEAYALKNRNKLALKWETPVGERGFSGGYRLQDWMPSKSGAASFAPCLKPYLKSKPAM